MNELKINSAKVTAKLIKFIHQQTKQAGFKTVVIGLSGGLDSSLVAFLCAQALGKQNVYGLILPYKTTASKNISYAKLIARRYQVKTKLIDITKQIDSYFNNFPDAEKIRRGNKMARERMSVLYDQSKQLTALVVGTGNKTELLLGYGTIYGDIACAFNPLGSLYKTQLRQLAKDVGIPEQIIKQVPSAGLWPGQSDEQELGLRYAEVDRLLYYLVDKKFSDQRLLKIGFKKQFVQKVKRIIQANAFKGTTPAIAKI